MRVRARAQPSENLACACVRVRARARAGACSRTRTCVLELWFRILLDVLIIFGNYVMVLKSRDIGEIGP